MDYHWLAWGAFLALVMAVLAFDLFVLHRTEREIKWCEAVVGAGVPVVLALLFAVFIYFAYQRHWLALGEHRGFSAQQVQDFNLPGNGGEAVSAFLTGYLVELSLSADNVFLFVILMKTFAVPREYQHRVLFWGVIGALVLRALMIVLGAQALHRFGWIIYALGGFLLLAGARMFMHRQRAVNMEQSRIIRTVRKIIPVSEIYHGKQFFVGVNGRTFATPLFLVLVAIELTDVLFALDSIPAIFGITRDAFMVFSSNVFAVLGVRSMYFLLAGVVDKFRYLKTGLALILIFVGIKMVFPLGNYIFSAWPRVHVSPGLSLGVIAVILAGTVAASLARPVRGK